MRRTFAASVLGRLPIGITGLAVLLLVQSSTQSFAQAGAATAGYVGGLAIVAPVLGRWIDRTGPRAALLLCGLSFPATLLALVAAVDYGAPGWLIVVLSASAGAVFPPISVCMRTYFRHRLADERLLAAAYSLESVLIELVFIVGPMLVAIFVALASPAFAVVFAAACGGAGALLFRASSALRAWTVAPKPRRGLLGPLAEPQFSILVVIILCYAMAFGLLEIGITAYATEQARPALAGVLLGLMSAGSALGGLAYGSRSWRFPLQRQFVAILAIMGLGLAVLALPWDPWTFAALTIVAGIVMAPALIMQSMLVARAAGHGHVTEAFTWSTSALLGGIGIGLVAGGALVELWLSSAAFATAAATALAAAVAGRFVLRS
ncbi:MAG TPA: MFS transporter [Burkholderiales bacterium]|nr:MFS transporter [Burkholderiales bacterium]